MQEDLPIFDPFFNKDFGTGLGLSITHGIIQNTGRSVWFKSRMGNNLKIELPAETHEKMPLKSAPPQKFKERLGRFGMELL